MEWLDFNLQDWLMLHLKIQIYLNWSRDVLGLRSYKAEKAPINDVQYVTILICFLVMIITLTFWCSIWRMNVVHNMLWWILVLHSQSLLQEMSSWDWKRTTLALWHKNVKWAVLDKMGKGSHLASCCQFHTVDHCIQCNLSTMLIAG